jgi:3-dehydrosphinganine reductase
VFLFLSTGNDEPTSEKVIQDMMRSRTNRILEGKIAIICGGSKGIGKETAKEFVRLGASVCIIARDPDVLSNAAEEIKTQLQTNSQHVETIACDATDMQVLKPLIEKYIAEQGIPDYLINMVGYAYPQYLELLKLQDFQENMQENYYGQLVPTLVLLPHFLGAGKGHVAFVSSISGFMGLIGYATYTPSKYALVGLAEVLRHELKPYNIRISVLFPPDTDTPGFIIENQTKPPETAMISETAKLLAPEQVAAAFVDGILKQKFYILVGEARWIWLVFRLFPWLGHWFIDRDLRQARKKLGKTI